MTQESYWQDKLSLWLHDPVHKMLDIRGHEARAAEIARLLEVSVPDKATYQNADMIAAGLTRAALPKYSEDERQNGAVNFREKPVLTHPLVQAASLELEPGTAQRIEAVQQELTRLLTEDLGLDKEADALEKIPEETRPLSGFFNKTNSPEGWAQALYFYLFFALQKRLRQENVGNLGGLWELLPADSRMPDHPVWHHVGLTSAIGSCMAEDAGHDIALAVFSITPVQAFIGKARKLRDHWTGSVLLSYLAFTGIRHVAETLGPDHIVYPSLHNQTLVEAWIGKEFHLERFLKEEDAALKKQQDEGASIASFPNKFVFLAPAEKVEAICQKIEASVQAEWLRVARLVQDFLVKRYGAGAALQALFEHQIADYWQFNHAGCRLAGLADADKAALEALLHPQKWSQERETVDAFAQAYGQSAQTTARLYGATHTLAQSLLAAAKMKPNRLRKEQQGEKCPLCGEHEVLHDFAQAGETSAGEYGKAVRHFWDSVREKKNAEDSFAQIGESERLCAVCTIKRFLPRVMSWSGNKEEILAKVFRDADKFPSTTEMAARLYLQRLTGKVTITREEYPHLVDALHQAESETADDERSQAMQAIIKEGKDKDIRFTDRDKYYALLLMDGDKMGDLINGQTLSATWHDVLHPDLQARFQQRDFQPASALRGCMNEKRLLNPALHAAISDGLNSFARYGVAPVVERLQGRLIYAGGDDVCAILPLDAALDAADAIRKAYTMGFVRYSTDGAEELPGTSTPDGSKLGLHLGKAEKISISAAIVLAHHKEPLREVLRDAHRVLDGIAKERASRNALAIRLKKRSGGDRDLWLNWDAPNPYCNETLLTSLKAVMADVSGDFLGSSLLYRLSDLQQAIAPLVTDESTRAANRELIVRLIAYEVGHSGKLIPKDKTQLVAQRLAGLMVQGSVGQQVKTAGWYNPEAAIIAHFLGARREA
ncbi:MAG: type III-B CRISPR-associated protein Cas10/Cmr2 [bacterium]|nr:type III-B CRISPR-associated protein Cas10/Cmr2 [bacterium]